VRRCHLWVQMSRRLGLLVVSVVVGTVVLFAAQLRAVGGSRGWCSVGDSVGGSVGGSVVGGRQSVCR